MEYLSDWPFQGTFLETPYGNLIGRELEIPTVQGAITGLPGVTVAIAVTPPPALTVVYGQTKEIEAVARNLFTHGPSFFSQVRRIGTQSKRQNLPSLQVRSRKEPDMALQVNSRKESDLAVSPQARTRYGI